MYDRDIKLYDSYDADIPSHNSDALKRSFTFNNSVI